MCRKAPRMLRSSLRAAQEQQRGDAVDGDADRGHAMHRRRRRPARAAARRRTASQAIAPIATSRSTALASAARIERAPQAVGARAVGRRRTSTAAPQASSRPSTSLRLCPASASSASESARSPKITSATTKPELSTTPMAKARPKLAGACTWPACTCPPCARPPCPCPACAGVAPPPPECECSWLEWS